MGKGDKLRPSFVSTQEFNERWDKAFSKTKKKKYTSTESLVHLPLLTQKDYSLLVEALVFSSSAEVCSNWNETQTLEILELAEQFIKKNDTVLPNLETYFPESVKEFETPSDKLLYDSDILRKKIKNIQLT